MFKLIGRLNCLAITRPFHTSVGRLATADQTASSVFNKVDKRTTGDTKWVSAGNGKGEISVREYAYSTSNFHVSPRKLRLLGNQITGLTLSEAIRQMQFSPKRAATKLKHSLVWARKHIVYQKQMNPEKCVVKVARVGKGKYTRRMDFKARGRFGVIRVPHAHMKYVLWEKHEETSRPRGVVERALLSGLPKRKVKGFKLTRRVWKPLTESKPVVNAKNYYNW